MPPFRNSKTPRREDLSDKDAKLVDLVLDVKDRYNTRRWIFEREWYRNILFYVGQQWIVSDESANRWRRRNMPSWVPLPVTNRLASTVNQIRSAVAQVQPAFRARPTQDNEKSVLTANGVDKYIDVIEHESKLRAAKRRKASWLTLTGNGFLFQEFDTSPETGMVFMPGEVCADCGTPIRPTEITEDLSCPNCGGKNLEPDEAAGEKMPQGASMTTALSPFEVYADANIMEIQEQPALLIIQAKSLDSVREMYGPVADDIAPCADRVLGRYYLDSLAYMTGSGYGYGTTYGMSTTDGAERTLLYKLYVKACKDYPDGVYVVMTDDQHVLEVHDPYPFRYNATNKKFYPIVHFRYDDVPGRFWGRTPIDDLVPKQRQRNEMESLFQVLTMRMSNPVWLVPTGVQTSPITGDSGLVIRHTGSGVNKPERLAGSEVPASVVKFIEMIDGDFEELANTFSVMKGKSPGSVRAASAIQMLIERGFGRYGSVFDNLEEGYEEWARQSLEIWRQRAIFPRVQAVAQTAGAFQFLEFAGSDLGEVDIRVEAGSTRPKSQAGQQMLINQMLQWGLLNVNDPEQKMKIAEVLGAANLLPGAEADIKVVAEENQKFMGWAQTAVRELSSGGVDPVMALQALGQTFPLKGDVILDHHPTHMVHHRRFALSEKFRTLPEVLKRMFVQHMIMAHYVPMATEIATGTGPTGLAALAAQSQAAGQAGQNIARGQPSTGAGPGGAVGPFGAARGGSESSEGM